MDLSLENIIFFCNLRIAPHFAFLLTLPSFLFKDLYSGQKLRGGAIVSWNFQIDNQYGTADIPSEQFSAWVWNLVKNNTYVIKYLFYFLHKKVK